MTAAPFLLLGDGWQNPTGLARIARDLHAMLGGVHVGYHPPGLLVGGTAAQQSWSHLGEDWGASLVVPALAEQYQGQRPGTLLVVWDPSRAYHYLVQMRRHLPDWSLWGYFAVDGHDARGSLSGQAAEAIRGFDRVTAYTHYGAEICKTIRPDAPVSYLPHGHAIAGPSYGLDGSSLFPRFDVARGDYLLGCVATNQPRKDHDFFVRVVAELRRRGERAWGWVHTDRLFKEGAFSLPDVVAAHGMTPWVRLTVSTLSDPQLHRLLTACLATICVGRGEGFGYPIVESLACGVPALGMDYAGGAEVTPATWRYQWAGVDYTNTAGVGRPRGVVEDAVDRVLAVKAESLKDRRELVEYCRGSVAHLHWNYLGPRWTSWLAQGLEKQ